MFDDKTTMLTDPPPTRSLKIEMDRLRLRSNIWFVRILVDPVEPCGRKRHEANDNELSRQKTDRRNDKQDLSSRPESCRDCTADT